MRITMLGTGNAAALECYNTCFVLQEKNQYFLVDGGGGNGLLCQMKKVGMDWKDIKEIFITHQHADHLLGIVWMVRMICQSMKQGNYEGDVFLYGHREVMILLENILKELLGEKVSQYIGKQLHMTVVEDQESREILGNKVTFFDIHSEKMKQFGFVMEFDGKRLTCCGDEPYRECERVYAENSTWLLHEAFCLDSQKGRYHPYEKYHCTVKDACEQAEMLHVENLLLYHTEDENLLERKQLYLNEGQQYFRGVLHVPDDSESLEL